MPYKPQSKCTAARAAMMEPKVRAAAARADLRRARFIVLAQARAHVASGAWHPGTLTEPAACELRVLAVCSPETIAEFELLQPVSR